MPKLQVNRAIRVDWSDEARRGGGTYTTLVYDLRVDVAVQEPARVGEGGLLCAGLPPETGGCHTEQRNPPRRHQYTVGAEGCCSSWAAVSTSMKIIVLAAGRDTCARTCRGVRDRAQATYVGSPGP